MPERSGALDRIRCAAILAVMFWSRAGADASNSAAGGHGAMPWGLLMLSNKIWILLGQGQRSAVAQ